MNVDALWENMLTGQPAAQISEPLEHTEGKDVVIQNAKTVAKTDDADQLEKSSGIPAQADALVGTSNNDEEMITIKRTYEFAGQTITEEKVVAKSSAEARLYLQSRLSPSAQPTQSASPIDPSKPSLRRPLKRTSRFEPNPTGEIKGLPAKQDKGVRLNTVQKSKMDWAGYVDKEGIANELDEHRKGKDNLLGRQDFLARVNGKKDDEWLNRKK